jgi:hypothetical protein
LTAISTSSTAERETTGDFTGGRIENIGLLRGLSGRAVGDHMIDQCNGHVQLLKHLDWQTGEGQAQASR